MWPNSQFPVNMATLTEETFTGKFHFCGRVLNTPLAYTYIYIYNIYILCTIKETVLSFLVTNRFRIAV